MTPELYLNVMASVLDAAGVRHFTPLELCPVGKVSGGVTLRPPPSSLFKNILPTLEVAEWLREQVGPLIVNSGYRDPAYNRAVGGAPSSLHAQFNALDLRSETVSPARLADLLETHPKAHTLGIGRYSSFVHLDARGAIGLPAPARWPAALATAA